MLWLLSWLKLYLLQLSIAPLAKIAQNVQLKDYCGKTFQSY